MLRELTFYTGQMLAAALVLLLAVAALAPSVCLRAWRGRLCTAFIGLFLLTAVIPTLGALAGAPPLLAGSPFWNWSLVSIPLSYENVQRHWPEGVCYATAVTSDTAGRHHERLLLDELNEPMNVSGLTLGYLPALMGTAEPRERRAMAAFLLRFLDEKRQYAARTGNYAISRRWLGRFAFPTANEHRPPVLPAPIERFEELRIYRAAWCPDVADYRFREAEIEWSGRRPKTLLAAYSCDANGSIQETLFQPAGKPPEGPSLSPSDMKREPLPLAVRGDNAQHN